MCNITFNRSNIVNVSHVTHAHYVQLKKTYTFTNNVSPMNSFRRQKVSLTDLFYGIFYTMRKIAQMGMGLAQSNNQSIFSLREASIVTIIITSAIGHFKWFTALRVLAEVSGIMGWGW